MYGNNVSESWGEVNGGNFSMVVGISLILVVLVDVFVEGFTLHLSLKDGLVLNCNFNFVSIFMFDCPKLFFYIQSEGCAHCT